MGGTTRKRAGGPRAGIADGLGGIRMTREQKYREQLTAMGIYQEAFEPELHTLAMMERELQRMVKAWKAAGSPISDETSNGTPTSSKMLDAISAMRRDILAHRDALGLTPKGLARLRGKTAAREKEDAPAPTVLQLLQTRRERRA